MNPTQKPEWSLIQPGDMPRALAERITPQAEIGRQISSEHPISISPVPVGLTLPNSPPNLATTYITQSPHDVWVASLERLCPHGCGGLGWIGGVSLGAVGDGAARLQRCPCRTAEDNAKLVAGLRANRGRFATVDFETFDAERNLPGACTWENGSFDEESRRYSPVVATVPEQRLMLRSGKMALKRWANGPSGWLWLQGNYGSGKSHLGAAACNMQANVGRSTYYDSVPRLLALLRAGISDHSIDQRVNTLMSVDILMLDDLGMGHISVWSEGQLADILNERYNAERPTIITSNVPILAFSGRGFSRCLEMCEVLELIAFDIRKVKFLERRSSP